MVCFHGLDARILRVDYQPRICLEEESCAPVNLVGPMHVKAETIKFSSRSLLYAFALGDPDLDNPSDHTPYAFRKCKRVRQANFQKGPTP
jgi:hypothetical protein